MTKVKSTDADLVYFGGTTQTNAGQFAKDSVAVGAKVKFMVPDGCREQALIDSAGNDNLDDRTYVTFGGLPPNELQVAARTSTRTIKRNTTPSPKPTPFTATKPRAWCSKASKRAGKKDRAAITEAITNLRNFDGASASGPSTKTATLL